MTIDATFVALVAFAAFFALLFYLKAPSALLSMIDQRRQLIAKELNDARRMREEAEKLLKDYEAKRAAAEAEAKSIVEAAKEQAAAVAEETRAAMAAAIARREKQAEDRIASAGAKAADDIRAAAADAAVAAAEKLILERMTGPAQAALVDSGVTELKRSFR